MHAHVHLAGQTRGSYYEAGGIMGAACNLMLSF